MAMVSQRNRDHFVTKSQSHEADIILNLGVVEAKPDDKEKSALGGFKSSGGGARTPSLVVNSHPLYH
jgi:hypothetical protein